MADDFENNKKFLEGKRLAYQQVNRGVYSDDAKWWNPKKWLTKGTGGAGEYNYDRLLQDADHIEKYWSDPERKVSDPDTYARDMGRAAVYRDLGQSSKKVQRGTNAIVDQAATNFVNGATFGLVGNNRIARSLSDMDELIGDTQEARWARAAGAGAYLTGAYLTGRGDVCRGWKSSANRRSRCLQHHFRSVSSAKHSSRRCKWSSV